MGKRNAKAISDRDMRDANALCRGEYISPSKELEQFSVLPQGKGQMGKVRTMTTPPDSNRYVLMFVHGTWRIGFREDSGKWFTDDLHEVHPTHWTSLPRKPKVIL